MYGQDNYTMEQLSAALEADHRSRAAHTEALQAHASALRSHEEALYESVRQARMS